MSLEEEMAAANVLVMQQAVIRRAAKVFMVGMQEDEYVEIMGCRSSECELR